MVTRNDITGDLLKSKLNNEKFEENFDKIFGQKKKTNGGWKPPTDVAMPTSSPNKPAEYAEDWQTNERDRAIEIGRAHV